MSSKEEREEAQNILWNNSVFWDFILIIDRLVNFNTHNIRNPLEYDLYRCGVRRR